MNIKIYYRHINDETNSPQRPSWFTYENAFISLFNSIKKSIYKENIDLVISFDDSMGGVEDNFISKYLNSNQLKVSAVQFTGGSQKKALQQSLILAKKDLEKNYNKKDVYIFLENDYIYCENWIDDLVELINSNIKFDYFSLYDHPDKYTNLNIRDVNKNRDFRSLIFSLGCRYWRTTPGTCASFGMVSEVLKHDYKYLKYFGAFGVFNDYLFFKFMTSIMGRRILTPLPGLATHAMNEFLSPMINWNKVLVEASGDDE
ncbi:hypothetical protein G6657_08190 [Polynucleobacter paneuropaeus]|jgi:hypothetical protein|nr:hypothetical protein [Polynucleobacter paneuropaeus]